MSSSPRRTTTSLKSLLIDPSLFTAPYDAALSAGLRENDVQPLWAVRRLRAGEEQLLAPDESWPLFYPLSDGPNRRAGSFGRALKGFEHVVGMSRLLRYVGQRKADIVHLQWGLLPSLDARFVRRMRPHCPVVMTVHDTTPFNGKDVSALQRSGFEELLASCDRLIVHTDAAATALGAQAGAPPITVVPHGFLPVQASATRTASRDDRWTIVMFGKIQHYKGADILIEALGQIDPDDRKRLRVIVAGEPLIPMAPLHARAEALGLGTSLEIREGRLSDTEVAELLDEADCFVFPYRAIEASGVLFLVANQGKWLIASDLGAFHQYVGEDEGVGALIRPDDAAALAEALRRSLGKRPTRSLSNAVPDWTEIGRRTRIVYEQALAAR